MANEWIYCSERMPPDGSKYLVYVMSSIVEDYGYVCILGYMSDLYKLDELDFYDKRGKGGFYMLDSEYGYYDVENVVAWMPLPEPPNKEK